MLGLAFTGVFYLRKIKVDRGRSKF